MDEVIQVETSCERTYDGADVVRVRYRKQGTRRWTKLVVFPSDGQTVDELLREGDLIAAAHLREGATDA